MTTTQRIALVFGVAFVGAAAAGFLLTGADMSADMDHAQKLLGVFPVNAVHNAVHLALGLWGLAAAWRPGAARLYCQLSGTAYLALAVLGIFSPTTFGMLPIGGADIWLHALFGVVLALVGFVIAPEEPAAREARATS